MIWVVALSTLVAAQTNFTPIRINCGGPQYVDPVTKFKWIGDSRKYVTTGFKESRCSNQTLTIANTTESMRGIYCCNRFFKPRFYSQHYTIAVLNTSASYIVRLHFAELVRYGYFISTLKLSTTNCLPLTFFCKGISRAKCTKNGCSNQ